MVKGSKVIQCETCARRRACLRRSDGDFWVWTCSKSHEWRRQKSTFDKIIEVTKSNLMPGLAERLFANNPLIARLRH